jgi:3-oxoacyl-[acyl-carrier protein] reductase
MNLSLKGKNALVGGGSKGLGAAVAIELAALGANVTLVSRNVKNLEKSLVKLDTSLGQQHDYAVADYSDSEGVRKIFGELAERRTYHILVNNTGGPPGGLISEAKTDDFIVAFSNHLVCNHIVTMALVPGMKTVGYGRIINIVSVSVKQPIDGLGVSNTTRGAVASWAKTLANELGPFGITVNNVLPSTAMTGRIQEIAQAAAQKAGLTTEQIYENWKKEIPLRRLADPSEVAAAVAFLATPAASYISGINLPVDGGRTKSL